MELNELVLGMKKKSFDGATGVIICDNDRNWDDELYNEIKKNIQYLVDNRVKEFIVGKFNQTTGKTLEIIKLFDIENLRTYYMPTLDESKNQQERVDCGVDLFAIKNDLSSVERDMYLLKTSDYIIYITEDNVLLFSKEFLY